MYKLGILGLGNMGKSILSGIIKSNIYNKEDILLYDIDDAKLEQFCNQGIIKAKNIDELVELSDTILLAIKPQNLNNIKINKTDKKYNIISIIAGKTVEDIREVFGQCDIIRVMPNTPSLIGYGTTVIAKNKYTNDILFQEAKKIFLSIGTVEEVDDAMINEVIPFNGSMPAFLYYYVKLYLEKAIELKLDESIAKKLIVNTIIGSSMMILNTDNSIEKLINDVCSPGGATLKGLEEMDKANLKLIINNVCDSCIKRAYELSKK